MSKKLTPVRLSKFAREYNLGIARIVDFLSKKGIKIDNNPNTKIPNDAHELLLEEFKTDKEVKEEASKIKLDSEAKKTISINEAKEEEKEKEEKEEAEDIVATPPKEKEEVLIKSQKIEVEKEEKKKPEKAEPKKKTPKAEKKKKVKEEDSDKTPEEEIPEKTTEETTKKKIKKTDKKEKEEILEEQHQEEKTEITDTAASEQEETPQETDEEVAKDSGPKVVGKIDLDKLNTKTKPAKKTKEEKEKERQLKIKEREEQKKKIKEEKNKRDEEAKKQSATTEGAEASEGQTEKRRKKRRKRIYKDDKTDGQRKEGAGKGQQQKPEISEEEIQQQIKATLARLSTTGKSKGAKYRRQKRELEKQSLQEQEEQLKEEKKTLKVTEYVTANELAQMMDVSVTEIISMCLNLGLFVSINQRLDAETIVIVAEELGYKVEFVDVDVQEDIEEEVDDEADLVERAPIVTVMGHVDHGKTKLLDFIRKTNVIAGEAGGITQHIGAYEVTMEDDRRIVFLDTPGHEAFTAMRARGAKVTDIAIIIIAADDGVMPQTKEAINHAQAAGVPLVIAINKIDKPTANPDKVMEQLSNINILVEDWGGKYQCQPIAAKEGTNIDLLLEKVLFEADLLELKANPKKRASGTIIESSLDKGRGYVSKVLVQNGTMKIGDTLVAGCHFGKVKAMYNERNQAIDEAGPATPALILGLAGAPQAGDTFNVLKDEKEAKNIALKRQQLIREQGLRTQKHITLDEIGRRIAIGDFKELNLIIKGDVDGSIEALTDSLIKLKTDEVQVNVIHKSVGSITESDVSLASASNAIIIGFQVRPTASAKKLAEQEQIDIRMYSIIYMAINEIKSAIEGMLSPEIEEKILCNIEVREVYHISKVGAVAGCMVLDGKINRNTKIRVIRDGIVIYTGVLDSLKRYKDDVKEVASGYECGLSVKSFNDIQVGDIIEGYEQIEIKRTLE